MQVLSPVLSSPTFTFADCYFNMADASHSELIAQFSNVTGVDTERATFYLESAAWNLDIAMASFYDDDNDDMGGNEPAPQPPPRQPSPPPAPNKAAKSKGSAGSRFATLASMKDEESDSDEEEGQAFYAGGSERGGGQQVLGPPKKKQTADEFVQNMFKAAKEHGAETVEAPGGSSAAPKRAAAFKGSGYRLGDSEGETPEVIPGASSRESGPRQVDLVLKLWKNGFSVDDGPLREYKDPANKEFLDSIHKGEVPRELIAMAKGGEVSLNMEDHRHEEYVKPKVPVKAFTGEGHTLGSPAPTLVGSQTTSPEQNENAAKTATKVDESQKTTNIQIRLADGSRLVAKFNHTHTVADIKQYIVTARPQFASSPFVLMTTFPNKELTDDSETLEGAKLLNAVIVQRIR